MFSPVIYFVYVFFELHIFRRVLSLGSSVHWSVVLELLTGHSNLTTRPFLQYYEPVNNWLKNFIETHDLHVGW